MAQIFPILAVSDRGNRLLPTSTWHGAEFSTAPRVSSQKITQPSNPFSPKELKFRNLAFHSPPTC